MRCDLGTAHAAFAALNLVIADLEKRCAATGLSSTHPTKSRNDIGATRARHELSLSSRGGDSLAT
jgi:hypothetical protein